MSSNTLSHLSHPKPSFPSITTDTPYSSTTATMIPPTNTRNSSNANQHPIVKKSVNEFSDFIQYRELEIHGGLLTAPWINFDIDGRLEQVDVWPNKHVPGVRYEKAFSERRPATTRQNCMKEGYDPMINGDVNSNPHVDSEGNMDPTYAEMLRISKLKQNAKNKKFSEDDSFAVKFMDTHLPPSFMLDPSFSVNKHLSVSMNPSIPVSMHMSIGDSETWSRMMNNTHPGVPSRMEFSNDEEWNAMLVEDSQLRLRFGDTLEEEKKQVKDFPANNQTIIPSENNSAFQTPAPSLYSPVPAPSSLAQNFPPTNPIHNGSPIVTMSDASITHPSRLSSLIIDSKASRKDTPAIQALPTVQQELPLQLDTHSFDLSRNNQDLMIVEHQLSVQFLNPVDIPSNHAMLQQVFSKPPSFNHVPTEVAGECTPHTEIQEDTTQATVVKEAVCEELAIDGTARKENGPNSNALNETVINNSVKKIAPPEVVLEETPAMSNVISKVPGMVDLSFNPSAESSFLELADNRKEAAPKRQKLNGRSETSAPYIAIHHKSTEEIQEEAEGPVKTRPPTQSARSVNSALQNSPAVAEIAELDQDSFSEKEPDIVELTPTTAPENSRKLVDALNETAPSAPSDSLLSDIISPPRPFHSVSKTPVRTYGRKRPTSSLVSALQPSSTMKAPKAVKMPRKEQPLQKKRTIVPVSPRPRDPVSLIKRHRFSTSTTGKPSAISTPRTIAKTHGLASRHLTTPAQQQVPTLCPSQTQVPQTPVRTAVPIQTPTTASTTPSQKQAPSTAATVSNLAIPTQNSLPSAAPAYTPSGKKCVGWVNIYEPEKITVDQEWTLNHRAAEKEAEECGRGVRARSKRKAKSEQN